MEIEQNIFIQLNSIVAFFKRIIGMLSTWNGLLHLESCEYGAVFVNSFILGLCICMYYIHNVWNALRKMSVNCMYVQYACNVQ